MATRYKIEITEFKTETKICGKEWKPVSGNPDQDYAYTPEIEKQVEVERKIYTQDTDSLGLAKVVIAVNGL
jgi:hypothetical protein